MSSVPLPALSIRPPQQQSPLDEYARVVQLKSLLQGQQIQSVQLQQAQMQLGDQQIVRQAFVDNDGDIEKTIRQAAKNGASPMTLMGLQQHGIQLRTQLAAASEAELKLQAAHTDNLRGALSVVYNAPDQQKADLWAKQRALVLSDPQRYGPMNPAQIPEQFPGKDAGELLMSSLIGHSQQVKDEIDRKKAVIGERPSEASLAYAAAGQTPEAAQAQKGLQLLQQQKLGEKEQPLGDRSAQLNQAMTERYQVLNPGKALPPYLALRPEHTAKDFDRVDKILQQTEQAKGTKAQQDTANAMRATMVEIARQGAAQKEEKQGEKWVSWTDPKTGAAVAGPLSSAKKAGMEDMAEVPTEQVRNIQDARGVSQLISKQGNPQKPETMGINQLIDSLEKDGKLGIGASRLNSFLVGKVGASPGDDPRIPTLLNKVNLAMTLSMKAHFGASGGRSPQMLAHFLQMANATKMNAVTLKAGINAIKDYMDDRGMIPPGQGPAGAQGAVRPPLSSFEK